jgi:hypothetical protein
MSTRPNTDYESISDNLGIALKALANMSIGGMTNANRIDNALAYIDRILSHNPNGAELMFLGEVKRILTGASDGRLANTTEANDAK